MNMARITALKAQKRNPNRVNVYLEGSFAFGVTRIVAAWLQVGQELDEEKIASLQAKDVREVALEKAIRFLGYRPRTETEVRKKLLEQAFDEESIEVVLERLRTNGLLADDRFAHSWVEQRATTRPRSRKLMALELRQKGVADEIIQAALEGAQDDESLAYQAASRYARRLEALDWDKFRERLSAYLLRRGFSYGTIGPVVKQVWSEAHAMGEST